MASFSTKDIIISRLKQVFLLLFFITACDQPDSFIEPAPKIYSITFQTTEDSPIAEASISTTYNLSCSSVFGGTTNFTQSTIVVTGTSGSIQILQNVSCTLTIASFFDGTSSYTPTSSPLAITISATGTVTSSGSLTNPPTYANTSGTHLYLFLASSTSSSLTFEYTYDPATQSTTFVSGGSSCTNGNCTGSSTTDSILMNFNSSTIAAGNYIWFNSAFIVQGLNVLVTTHVFLTNSTVTFINGTTHYSIAIPDAIITFSPSASCGTTTFSSNTWQTTLPALGSITDGDIFLSGVGYAVTSSLPATLKRITWQGQFNIDQAGVTVEWAWAAAVYNTNITNEASLGVKSVSTGDCTYSNTDTSGTPENEKSHLVAGGTGTGGTNYTGTLGSASINTPTDCTPACTTSGYERCPLICTPPPITPGGGF